MLLLRMNNMSYNNVHIGKKDQCKDAELMLKLKIIVVLFCNTIEEVQFPTIQLSDLLKEIRYTNLFALDVLKVFVL